MNNSPERDEAIFEAALALPPDQRAAYLDQICVGDAQLSQRLEAMLREYEQAGHFMANTDAPAPAPTVSPDNPLRIPLVVRIYGILTMALGILGIAVFVLHFVLRHSGDPEGLLIWGVAILLMVVVFRIGKGMRSGERQALYGFCLLALIDVAFRMVSLATKPGTHHLWYLLFALGLFYIPPVVSAFLHWAAFK